MTYATPPRDWTVTSGTWGTDIDRNETLHESAGYSIEFLPTTPASPPRAESQLTEVRYDRLTRVFARVRSTSIAAGHTVHCYVNWYDKDRAFISGAGLDQLLTAADTWEWLGSTYTPPAGARYATAEIGKVNAVAPGYTVYFDEVAIEPVPYHFESRLITANQAVATGIAGAHTIVFNSADREEGATLNVATGEVTLHVPGIWVISTHIDFDDLGDGVSAQAQIFSGGAFDWQCAYQTNGAVADMTLTGTHPTFVAGNQTIVTTRVGHNHGANRNVLIGSRMSGVLVDGR